MRTVLIVVAIVMSAVANIGIAEAQAGQNAPAAVASQAARNAWFARAVDNILTASTRVPDRDAIEQGRSAGRYTPR